MNNKTKFTHKAELYNKEIYTNFHEYSYTEDLSKIHHVDRSELHQMRGDIKLEKDIVVDEI